MELFIPNSQLLYTSVRADGTHLQYVNAAWSRTLWARTALQPQVGFSTTTNLAKSLHINNEIIAFRLKALAFNQRLTTQ